MGPLLVIFVGLALFAFIAGDAWRLFQSDSMEATVGTIDGEKLSAVDFQDLYNECETAQRMFKMSDPRLSDDQKTASFTEAELAYIKEEAWGVFTQLAVAEKQAEELGITVTNEEIMDILNNNGSNYLNSVYHPFRTESGFSTDDLNAVIAAYNQMKNDGADYDSNLAALYNCWKYMEKRIKLEALINKQVKLVENATIANPVLAKKNFEMNDNAFNIEVAAFPYTSVADSLVSVSDKEIENYYNANKEYLYEQMQDTRDIKYISVKINASESDKQELLSQMNEYADMLKSGDKEYERIARVAQSELAYNDLLWSKEVFPEDIQVRIEQANVNEVVGPYINPSDNSYNVFMTTEKTTVPDSLLIRAIVVNSQSSEEVEATTDSLLNALKNKADFNKLAENYSADTVEFKTKNFITTIGFIPTPEAQNLVYTAKVNEYNVIDFGTNAKLIFQVMEKKGNVEAYDALIIERRIPVSADTYNKEYNKLSQLVTSCQNLEDLQKNILSTSYRLEQQRSLNSNSLNVANKPGTRDLLRWVLGGRNTGDISNIHEYIAGNKKYFIVAAIKEVTPQGHVALEKVKENIKFQLINEKKGDLIAAELKGKSLEDLKANENVKFSTTDQVEYKKATSVQSINADELVISAAVANMQAGEVSAPIKGNNAVYVVKVLSKESKNAQFDAAAEADYIQSLDFYGNPNVIGQLIQETIGKTYNVENKVYEHM